MLAQKFEDRVDGLSFPLYTQPKLDGVRCIVYMQDGELVAKSRQGKPIDTVVHILEELKPFLSKVQTQCLTENFTITITRTTLIKSFHLSAK